MGQQLGARRTLEREEDQSTIKDKDWLQTLNPLNFLRCQQLRTVTVTITV